MIRKYYKDILIIFVFLFLFNILIPKDTEEFSNNTKSNVCRGYLSDIDYLSHMIPHHQVAIDISVKLQQITKSPVMQEILRNHKEFSRRI